MNGKKKNKKGTAAKIKYKKKKSWKRKKRNKNKGKITNEGCVRKRRSSKKKGVELERVNEVLELLCV